MNIYIASLDKISKIQISNKYLKYKISKVDATSFSKKESKKQLLQKA